MSIESRHSSETVEHFTPPEVVDRVWRTLGRIDLDPASCALANELVEAESFHDRAADGFTREWGGRVFLNPPGGLCDATGRPVYTATKKRRGCAETGACGLAPGHQHEGVTSSAKAWWYKLAREFAAGRVEAAVFLGFSVELMQSAQVGPPIGPSGKPLRTPLDWTFCVPSRRLQFLVETPDGGFARGESPPHSSFIVCVGRGDVVGRFRAAFESLGQVVWRD